MRKVLAGGCFDILHSGHIKFLEKAKSYGDCLVVMVSSDARVRHKKGKGRTILSQEERKFIIESLGVVDQAIVIEGDPSKNPILRVLEDVKPDIYIRTSEVNPQTLDSEVKICRRLGIKMRVISRIKGINYKSSTEIIGRIRNT
jgi:D-beta-D-heptose 7-phosphate kinase/D-beta-D-heptose 1-phosphate adenosyltransferase